MFFPLCWSEGECKELLSELASALQDASQYGDAALIRHSYLNQASDAVRIFCLGHLWNEARQVAKFHGLNDTIGMQFSGSSMWPLDFSLCCGIKTSLDFWTESVVHPCAVEYAQTLLNQIKSTFDQFQSYLNRLLEVRREKQLAFERQEAHGKYCWLMFSQNHLFWYAYSIYSSEGNPDKFGESDLLSDTSSVTGGSSSSSKGSSRCVLNGLGIIIILLCFVETKYLNAFSFILSLSSGSNRSSKNRRKQERKVLSLKKGSPHEDLALIYALHQSITSTISLRGRISKEVQFFTLSS